MLSQPFESRRYSNPKGEGIDVMYGNIRYAFFQPAENDMITILHFHLINPIMIGNKKHKDIQFYCEVRELIGVLRGI
jgi:nucleosome binding factor SPN SPT16 subunit